MIGKKYIDAENHVLGRLASYIAKYALEGYEVYVFNSEKSILTGRWNYLIEKWNHKVNERGDWLKGPFYPKSPDKIFRRVVRGMLPRNWRGKEALKRVKVFIGVPEEFNNVEKEKINDCLIEEKVTVGTVKEYHTLGDISRQIGGKF